MVDYKALLEKYIQHVGGCEGVDFIDEVDDKGRMYRHRGSTVVFTPEEAAELQRLAGYRPWPTNKK